MIKYGIVLMIIGTIVSILFMYIGNPSFKLSDISFWDTLLLSNFSTGIALYLAIYYLKIKL
jgi:hypothetical protein